MATVGNGVKAGSLGLAALPGLHRLAEAIALAIHLENVAVVAETVEQRRRHPLALEDLAPLAKRQVARHQDSASLVTVGEHPEQQLDAAPAHGDVAQLVADQPVRPVELAQGPVQRVLLPFLSSWLTSPAAVKNRTRSPARQAARPRPPARCVFPVPLPPTRQQMSFRSIHSHRASSSTLGLDSPGITLKS